MARKQEVNNKTPYPLIEKIYIAAMKEIKSLPGKINLALDIILALIIVVYILASALPNIILPICAIFNPALIDYVGKDGPLLILLIIFGFFTFACLVFMYITHVAERKLQ